MARATETWKRREATLMSDPLWLWTAKATGAVAGSAISLAYVLPAERREAGIRFGIGVASGLVFGGTAGTKIAVELGIEKSLGASELMLMGSAAASLCAWWALGLLMRAFRLNGQRRSSRDEE
ncbi:DUF6107 family protein [Mesorhizobium sp. CAU 1741]|uniref:DUF6107 family protein n=1 Tax=Mesorhizobium sp. CAU 1741 TaxID=3140366 RepID=UPI00325BCE89